MYFLVAVTKCMKGSNLRKEGFISAQFEGRVHHVRESMVQEHGAADHTAPLSGNRKR